MTDWSAIERFLATDPRDVGCEQAREMLHLYVDMVFDDSFDSAAHRYPGIAAHLAACPPCDDDLHGLLSAVEATS